MDLIASKGSSPRLAVFGEWDGTNLGDWAILEGIKAFSHEIGWHVDAYGLGTLLPCQKLSQTYIQPLTSQKEYLKMITLAQAPLSLAAGFRTSYPHTYRFLKRSLRHLRQQIRIRQLLPSLRGAHAILVGGGALLSDLDLHFPQSVSVVRWAAKKLHIPLFCIGCSIEGHWSTRGRRIFTEFFRSCSYIAARDRRTATQISSCLNSPVEIFGDFALPSTTRVAHRDFMPSRYNLSINVMCLSKLVANYQSQYEDILVRIADAFMKQNALSNVPYIQIFTTGMDIDVAPAVRVLQRLSRWNPYLCVPNTLEGLRELLRSSTVVLASRLHSAILSISEGVPVLGLSASQKINAFFESIGLHKYAISIFDTDIVNISNKLLLSKDVLEQISSLNMMEMQRTRNKISSILRGFNL